MFVEKLYYHLLAYSKMAAYKLIYSGRVSSGKGVTFRRGFSLNYCWGKGLL